LEEVLKEMKENNEKIHGEKVVGKAPSGSELDRTLHHGHKPNSAAGAGGVVRRVLGEVNGRNFADDLSLKTRRFGEVEHKETPTQEELRLEKLAHARTKEEYGKMLAEKTRLEALVHCAEQNGGSIPKESKYRTLTSIMHSFDGPIDEPTRLSGRLSMASEATIRDGDVKRTLQEHFNRQAEESLLRRQTEQNEQSLKERVGHLEAQLVKAKEEKRAMEGSLAQAKFHANQTQVVEEEKKALQSKRDEATSQLRDVREKEKVLEMRLQQRELDILAIDEMLRKEQKSISMVWPEFRKLQAKQDHGLLEENDRLKHRLTELDMELQDCKRELDILRKPATGVGAGEGRQLNA